MKNNLKYFLISLVFIILSCKKNGEDLQIVNPLNGKIKSFTYTDNENAFSQKHVINYNNDGLPVKLITDSLLSIEILSISDSIVKANVYMSIIDDEPPYNYEPVLYEIKLDGKRIINIKNLRFSLPYSALEVNYDNDKTISYKASTQLNLGISPFPMSDFFASDIQNNINSTSFQLDFDELDPFYNVIHKKLNLIFENEVTIIDKMNFIPLQYFIQAGDWITQANYDECSRLIYLLALNGYQVGPPMEKYISKLYIDDDIFRVYEYEKGVNGKVNQMHLKNSPEQEPYATFTMEYY